MYADAIACYVQILEVSLPIAITFGFCDLIVGTFMRVAFGGRLRLSGGAK